MEDQRICFPNLFKPLKSVAHKSRILRLYLDGCCRPDLKWFFRKPDFIKLDWELVQRLDRKQKDGDKISQLDSLLKLVWVYSLWVMNFTRKSWNSRQFLLKERFFFFSNFHNFLERNIEGKVKDGKQGGEMQTDASKDSNGSWQLCAKETARRDPVFFIMNRK